MPAAGSGRAEAQQVTAALPPGAAEQVRAWFAAAGGLRLRWVPLLSADDPATLARVRSDWRLRPLLGAQLAAQHTLVHPQRLPELERKLNRRGLFPAVSATPRTGGAPGAVSAAVAGYLWLAARVYQQLGAWVAPQVAVPGAAVAWAAGHISPHERDALAAAADDVIAQLAAAIAGKNGRRPADISAEAANAGVERTVRAAWAAGEAVTIAYHSPTYGASVRRIAPRLVYESDGATYVEAWCERDQAERTFRLDRVQGVQ